MKTKKSTPSLYRIFRIYFGLIKFNFFKYKFLFKTGFFAGFLFLKFIQYRIQLNNSNNKNIFNSSYNT
ncbi:hypothetical protein GCM10007963_21580 [Lutibacter litoralis]|nr:hypothetical protein GCM10007963_21580 [Lutibacter litoralis]